MTSHSKKPNNLKSWLNDYFSIVVILVLVLFFFLSYWLVLGPKFFSTKTTIKAEISGEERLYTSSQNKLATLMDIQKVYQNIKTSDLQKFNTVLPPKYVPERLFGELAEIVQSGGWIVSNITFIPNVIQIAGKSKSEIARARLAANRPGLKKVNFTLSVSAINYPGLKRLLHLLENNLRLIDINSLKFSPSAHTVVLNLTTYYYKTAQ